MNTSKIKTCSITLASALGLVAVHSLAQQEEHEQALREMNIMSNIFEAAMEQDAEESGLRMASDPDAIYLANQGMVFTFQLRNNMGFQYRMGTLNGDLQSLSRSIQVIAGEAVREVQSSFPDLDFDFDFDFEQDFEPDISGAATLDLANLEMLREQQEVLREMSEEMRDTQEEIRDRQREIRSLQRSMRDDEADLDATREQVAELELAIQTEQDELEAQRSAYNNFSEELEARRQEQMETVSREFTGKIVTVLCDYGATMRSLADNQYITVVLENYTRDQDQVYVFEYSDITGCSSADTLLESAVSYRL